MTLAPGERGCRRCKRDLVGLKANAIYCGSSCRSLAAKARKARREARRAGIVRQKRVQARPRGSRPGLSVYFPNPAAARAVLRLLRQFRRDELLKEYGQAAQAIEHAIKRRAPIRTGNLR